MNEPRLQILAALECIRAGTPTCAIEHLNSALSNLDALNKSLDLMTEQRDEHLARCVRIETAMYKVKNGLCYPDEYYKVAQEALADSERLPWNYFYSASIEDASVTADICKDEGDMYGWNYWQGKRAGLIEADIQRKMEEVK